MEKKDVITNGGISELNSNNIVHSQKYRKFIVTNSILFFVSRVLSLVYVYVVTRLISDEVMAIMILLAAFQIIFVNLVPMGFSYAATQWTLSEKDPTSIYLKNYYSYTIYVSFPLMIFISSLLLAYSNIPLLSVSSILYISANLLTLVLELMRNTEVALYNTDKAALLTGVYSIFNSIFVPVFYFFLTKDLSSILLAWNIGLILVISLGFRRSIRFFSLQVNFSEWKKMFVFSFPVLITTALNIFNSQINRIFIYEMFENQSLNTFHWVDRNLMIGLQMVTILLSGVYSLLVKLRSEDYERFEKVSRTLFRTISITSFFVFMMFLINAEFIVPFLLGEKYSSGILWMKFLALVYIPQSIVSYLLIRFLANENRLEIIIVRGSELVIRIVVALILLSMQIYGLLIAIMISTLFSLIILSSRAQELRKWDKSNLLRYSVFMLIGFSLIILSDLLLIWPLNNIALVLLVLLLFSLKPFHTQDIEYIERVIPSVGKRYLSPIIKYFGSG